MNYELRTASDKLVQVSVGRGVSQQAAHGDDLALVMERVAQDVMKNERRSADVDISIRKTQFRIGVELLVRDSGQIGQGLPAYLLLQQPRLADVGAVGGRPGSKGDSLQHVNPESLAAEDVDYLLLNRGAAKAGEFRGVVASGNRG